MGGFGALGGGEGRGGGGRAQEGGCVGSWVRYTYPGWRPLGLTPLSTVPSLTGRQRRRVRARSSASSRVLGMKEGGVTGISLPVSGKTVDAVLAPTPKRVTGGWGCVWGGGERLFFFFYMFIERGVGVERA